MSCSVGQEITCFNRTCKLICVHNHTLFL
jgi:hypothetical protein